MAVPFNMPEDQNEVEVIINQLQSLLTKLQAAVRRSRGPTIRTNQTAVTRVRSPASSRLRSRDESSATTSISSTNFPDLLNNIAWLAAASQDAASTSSSLTANSVTRSPRRRTSSESSNCKETKISITAIVNHAQDWNQADGSPDSEPEQASGDGILSKFVPGPVSAPLWTAMICFVGWHLFRAR
ncbi:uncharacterized protein LOC108912811 [Anoplophora glabripennis]|uniref:uncharacterized protein LOC108912811 n=1 Tax=Anoplophora glabripennis TaxID=217634 RepID=UPI0008746192|nr:uncharacterized protein LOC108912811 [Anoplophora glabripennis]